MDTIYTIAELANKLDVTERTLTDAIKDGRLKGYKQFRKWYITQTQLLEFLQSNQDENIENSKRPSVNPNK